MCVLIVKSQLQPEDATAC